MGCLLDEDVLGSGTVAPLPRAIPAPCGCSWPYQLPSPGGSPGALQACGGVSCSRSFSPALQPPRQAWPRKAILHLNILSSESAQ